MDGASIDGKGNSAVGYGASLGYTHQSGFGLSADYLGFNNKWNSGGNNYDASFHALTLTPSYRFALDRGNQWGLRLGLGVGLSLSDITWGSGGKTANALTTTNNPAGKMAGGATFFSMALTGTLKAGCGANSALQRAYSDSLGGTGNVTLTGNKCENNTLAVADGLTDLEIANLFTPNTGVAKDSSNPITISSGKSSYGVWRRLFTDVMAASTSWGQVAAGGFTAFETRAEYITRCTTSSCERQAATEAGALAAANIVNSDDPNPPPANPPPANPPPASKAKDDKAKDDAGFVLVPQVALEYDNGMFHGDINVRYIHAMKNVKYDGTGDVMGKTYSINAGPAALFVGAGFGVNF